MNRCAQGYEPSVGANMTVSCRLVSTTLSVLCVVCCVCWFFFFLFKIFPILFYVLTVLNACCVYRVFLDLAHCMAQGSFFATNPSCSASLCKSSVVVPTYGSVLPSTTGRTGESRTFTCNAGFTLEGSNVTTCQTTGLWAPSSPTCQDINECSYGFNFL
jgi:hypothetical protein